MFYELLNILDFDFFTYKEGLVMNKKKIKKAKKKAKKMVKQSEKAVQETIEIVGDSANEIQKSTSKSSNSLCNRDILPNREDLKIFLDKVKETENNKNIKNDENTNKINELNKIYNYWLNFNNDYDKNLLDYEKDFLEYTYGKNYYDEILLKRDNYNNKIDTSNLFNKDFNNLDKNLKKTIFINKEINNNKIILERNIENIKIEKQKLNDKINNTNNTIYVDNRDSDYDNNLYSYYLFLIQIILYFYSFFYIIYFLQEINKNNSRYFELVVKLIIIALLPNIIFDNFIFIIHKIINFF